MEALGQFFSSTGTVLLVAAGVAGFAAKRVNREYARRLWRGGALVGVGALFFGVLFRTVVTVQRSQGWLPLTSADDRATWIAFLAALLTVGPLVRDVTVNRRRAGSRPVVEMGWASLILVAVVTRIRITGQPAGMSAAPVLSLCVSSVAALLLWSAGQAVDVLASDRRDSRHALLWGFAGLAVAVLSVGGANKWFWGTPTETNTVWLVLVALWLAAMARLTWRRRYIWLAGLLDVLIAGLLVGVASNVRWVLPFS